MVYTHAHIHKHTRTRYTRMFVSVSLVALLFSELLQVGSHIVLVTLINSRANHCNFVFWKMYDQDDYYAVSEN